MNEVCFTFGITSFTIVRADACSRTLELIGIIIFVLFLTEVFTKVVDYMYIDYWSLSSKELKN